MPDPRTHARLLAELTSTRVVMVEPNETLRAVIHHFIEDGVDFVVVGGRASVGGVVSEHDVVRAIHDGADVDEVWAADIMTTDLVTVAGDATIGEAAELMTANQIRHLLLLGDEGGVLSIGDLLEALVA